MESIKYFSATLFVYLLSATIAYTQSNYIFSDESCLKNHLAEECFTTLIWNDKDQHIFLMHDSTIAINDPGNGQFFLYFRQVENFTLLELITRKQKDEEVVMPDLEVSQDKITYNDFQLNLAKESNEFICRGISKQLQNDERFFRLSTGHRDTFIYLHFIPKL